MSWKNILKNTQPQEVGFWYSPQGWINTNSGELEYVWDMAFNAKLMQKPESKETDWYDVGIKFLGKTILFKNEYQDNNHKQQARGMAGKFGLVGNYDKEHETLLDSILSIVDNAGMESVEFANSYFDINAAQNYLNKLKQQVQKPQPKKGMFGRFRR